MTSSEILDLFTNHGKRKLTPELAVASIDFALNEIVNSSELGILAPGRIIDACNNNFIGDCTERNSLHDNVLCRQCVFYLFYRHTLLSLREIATKFGLKDHQIVLYSVKKFKSRLVDLDVLDTYRGVLAELGIEDRPTVRRDFNKRPVPCNQHE